jgi:arsenite methyltransferase
VCRIDQSSRSTHSSDAASSENIDGIRDAIRSKYAEVSVSAAGKFQYPTGEEGAIALKYDQEIIRRASRSLLESFCGVGNPFSLGMIKSPDVVLDVGCGAGFDMFVTRKLVGEKARICGVDLTDQMLKKAQKNLSDAGITNFEIKKVDSENIPYADYTFDVVISNGVINLSPFKNKLFEEIYRVLKPGGSLQFADVVLDKEMPSQLSGSLEAWSQ